MLMISKIKGSTVGNNAEAFGKNYCQSLIVNRDLSCYSDKIYLTRHIRITDGAISEMN